MPARPRSASLLLAAALTLTATACASSSSSSSAHPGFTPVTQSFSSAPAAAGSPSASSPAAPGMLSQGQSTTLSNDSNATIGTISVSLSTVTTQSQDGSGNSPVNGWFVVMKVDRKSVV